METECMTINTVIDLAVKELNMKHSIKTIQSGRLPYLLRHREHRIPTNNAKQLACLLVKDSVFINNLVY